MIFKCKVDGPEIQNAQYNIVWQKDGVTVATSTTMSTSVPATISLLELFKAQDLRAVKMGFNVISISENTSANYSLFFSWFAASVPSLSAARESLLPNIVRLFTLDFQ